MIEIKQTKLRDGAAEHDGVWKLDPRIEAAQHEMYAALNAHGEKPDNLVATCWDAGLIVVDALKTLGPDATGEADPRLHRESHELRRRRWVLQLQGKSGARA